ncbi:rCG36962 [Rattus norvegicus]|uniref:RCG36962 n=1 Tax=Rattus norvegicus TaxID=10116 RepID=A6HUF2_RAT|nr:rCG36962 [Rattus norvegicus]
MGNVRKTSTEDLRTAMQIRLAWHPGQSVTELQRYYYCRDNCKHNT